VTLLTPAARDWAVTHGLRVVVILLLALVARQIVARAVPIAVRRSLVFGHEEDARLEQLKRADTLIGVILGTTTALLIIVAAFFAMAEMGFSIAPVIAGVSITGIAIGLGAQTLVKDVVNGMFILGENQFRRGDMVTVANVSGTVEDVSLRRTLLRGEDGTVYIVPNSAISVAGNHTRGYSGIYFLVAISFQADLERAIHEINRIGKELAADPEFGALIIDPPRALAVDALEDSYVNLRIDGRARPGAQGQVAGELRRRIKQEFDQLGIPYRGSSTQNAT
jgi:small-conductance mechanosensitive channel